MLISSLTNLNLFEYPAHNTHFRLLEVTVSSTLVSRAQRPEPPREFRAELSMLCPAARYFVMMASV